MLALHGRHAGRRRDGRARELGTRHHRGLASLTYKIFIHALKTETIVGIFDWERQVKQTVVLDIEFSADIRKAALTDSIDDTLNYKGVAKRVLGFIEESSFHLVETLAEGVARLILEEFGVTSVRIVLSKPGAVRNSRDVGIVIERAREDLAC